MYSEHSGLVKRPSGNRVELSKGNDCRRRHQRQIIWKFTDEIKDLQFSSVREHDMIYV